MGLVFLIFYEIGSTCAAWRGHSAALRSLSLSHLAAMMGGLR